MCDALSCLIGKLNHFHRNGEEPFIDAPGELLLGQPDHLRFDLDKAVVL